MSAASDPGDRPPAISPLPECELDEVASVHKSTAASSAGVDAAACPPASRASHDDLSMLVDVAALSRPAPMVLPARVARASPPPVELQTLNEPTLSASNAGPGWPPQDPAADVNPYAGHWQYPPHGASALPVFSNTSFVSYVPVTYMVPVYMTAPAGPSQSQAGGGRDMAGPVRAPQRPSRGYAPYDNRPPVASSVAPAARDEKKKRARKTKRDGVSRDKE
ncbi:hypothetical protein C8Q80DRAFT_1353453 [Daedaleopsis nitida]|nr:hypothetical protein C8Q80DRAFT_1353453 [Daedaleopsis nitida]